MHWPRSQADTAHKQLGQGVLSGQSQAWLGRPTLLPTARGWGPTADGTRVARRELRRAPGVISSPMCPSQKMAEESGDAPGEMRSAAVPMWPGLAWPGLLQDQLSCPAILMHTRVLVTDHEAWFLAQELWSVWLERLGLSSHPGTWGQGGRMGRGRWGNETSLVLESKGQRLNYTKLSQPFRPDCPPPPVCLNGRGRVGLGRLSESHSSSLL